MTFDPTFKVWTGETEDGETFAYSDVEPLFCFICASEDEALEAARETVVEYARIFKGHDTPAVFRPLTALPVYQIAAQKGYALEEA